MKTYRTKLEAYEQGHIKGWQEGLVQGIKEGIAQERARAKKKLDPHYNRPLSLKERVDREAEVYFGLDTANDMADSTVYMLKGIGLGKTKQPSLWSRFVKFINPKQYLM